MSSTPAPRLAVTPGEPAGIGPDLVIQLAAAGDLPAGLVVVADPDLLEQRAHRLGHAIELQEYRPDTRQEPAESGGTVTIWPVPLTAEVAPGSPNPANAEYVLETLNRACQSCLDGTLAGMVTGPIHKGVINEAGIPFSGHTEYLARRCGVEQTVMLLTDGSLRVALATTHLPLRDVAATLSSALLERVIRILDADLRRWFGLNHPRILVLGLNPHAGEGGHLGREEIDVIQPVLSRLQQEGLALTGPAPADTAFTSTARNRYDAVLAMYHDQGLPVLKATGFGHTVNITLGLPIIRTSVDHGTALDLAGSGRADAGSLMSAIRTAREMTSRGASRRTQA